MNKILENPNFVKRLSESIGTQHLSTISGFVTCIKAWSKTEKTEKATLAEQMNVKFDKPYDSPPMIFLSIVGAEIKGWHEYYLKAENITKNGFLASIYVADGTVIGDCAIQWVALSFGQWDINAIPNENSILD